jgi:TolB protein
MRFRLTAAAAILAAAACHRAPSSDAAPATRFVAAENGERHLGPIRQITAGGENAEAYFSADGRRLIFQSTRDGRTCDQQYVVDIDGTDLKRVSNGQGKTTCGYFMDGDRHIFYASTHAADTACPPRPDPSKGYVWGLDPFDIYSARADGSAPRRLTNYGVYTAEGTLSPDGRTIVFTSLKDGDLDIYTMSADGSNIRRLTSTPGYDGGPFFSPDGKQIVYRAWHPTDSAELARYQGLLAQRLVRPNRMELWIMNSDGSNQRQITNLGGANFAPFFTPDGRKIIFSSNHHTDPRAGNFDLFLIGVDGQGLEQITFETRFDGFPQFSPDGTKLVWASNRHAGNPRETNIFIAEWRP